MKKKIYLILILSVVLSIVVVPMFCMAQQTTAIPETTVFSEYLTDFASGQELSSVNADEKHEIASMVKIMTANLVFEAIENGKFTLYSDITISETASSMGGSQMFLDANKVYKVKDLIKGIIVVSANDASVAMAEVIAGSHEGFVNLMNARAKELGMNNTLFCNATGLPSEKEQYSTARDVNIMTRQLMTHKLYFDFAKITLEDYVHPDGRITQLVNTNKLIRHYKGCIGGKTGYTAKAGFCLSACAERNNLKVVATVIGAADSKSRFKKVSNMFDFAFSNYSNHFVCNKGDVIEQKVAVKSGKQDVIDVVASQDISILYKNGDPKPVIKYDLPECVKAPIKQGDKVGVATISYNDKTIEIDLLAKDSVNKISFWDWIKKISNKY